MQHDNLCVRNVAPGDVTYMGVTPGDVTYAVLRLLGNIFGLNLRLGAGECYAVNAYFAFVHFLTI